MSEISYPASHQSDFQESVLGLTFDNPYHWLETDNTDTQAWVKQQNVITEHYIKNWGEYDKLHQQIQTLQGSHGCLLPTFRAKQWYWHDGKTIYCSEEAFGQAKTIINIGTLSFNKKSVITWQSPSPDGQCIAFGVCHDGSEKNEIYIVDTHSTNLIDKRPQQILMDAWTGGACWHPDGGGFFFLALENDTESFEQQLYFFSLSSGHTESVEVEGLPSTVHGYRIIATSPDDQYLTLFEGLTSPIPVAYLALNTASHTWKRFISLEDSYVDGFIFQGDFFGITTVDAPNGRVVKIPLTLDDPNDSSQWIEIIPESDSILRRIQLFNGKLCLSEFIDTWSKIRIFSLDGNCLHHIPLSGKISDRMALMEPMFPLMNSVAQGSREEFVFALSSLTESWGVYTLDMDSGQINTLKEPEILLDDCLFETEYAESSDGTMIPYHALRLKEVDISQPQPTLLWAYGAFNYPLSPIFPGEIVSFIKAGGIFIHAHIRGGGELGKNWWDGGRRNNKQNGYQDLYAIAEQRIRNNSSSPSKLAVVGVSNGGLMAGVALTQRPELWKAVISRVPILDLMGSLREPYSTMVVNPEYGDTSDKEDIIRLSEFSPYHQICEGKNYPAIFLDVGGTDTRCLPSHARKFAAKLQSIQSNKQPCLLREWSNVGHGYATEPSLAIEQETLWIAFLMQQLDMKVRG